jgi:hypothetical protein|tara:strand:+ start:813 stop:1361 length:549 start_codon:yes stop_codon:yes gene_type:complete
MKEQVLREMIQKQIKSSLKESPMASARVEKGLGRIEGMAGVKMLKQALGQGTPQQQAAGLLKVVQAISGNNPSTGKMLARMLMKGGIASDMPEEPVGENYTPGVDDGIAQSNVAADEVEENKSLATKLGRVDKTQAMVQLKNQLGNKSASIQSDFVMDLINGLGLKDAAKQRLKMNFRKELK